MSSNEILLAVVDDEEDIIGLFSDALKRISNVRVFSFTSPVLALEHFTINKDQYAVVISDLRMPELNGLELIKMVKNMNPKVRTLLMTAFEIDDKLFQEYIKPQIINKFLQKPIQIEHLLEEVNNQLHSYQLQKQKSLIKIK